MVDWVSVKEKLPEEDEWVLSFRHPITTNDGGYFVAKHDGSGWCDGEAYFGYGGEVTHWATLPPPPK